MCNKKTNVPKVLFSGIGSWHMSNTAIELEKLNSLAGFWTGSKPTSKINTKFTRLIWPYFAVQRPFSIMSYHTAIKIGTTKINLLNNLEEAMRWNNLYLYDLWMSFQKIPEQVNIVQAPMGSCEALFKLAEKTSRRILKVFDGTNSHPTTYFGYWQRECDIYSPGYRIPMARSALSRINRELEMADLILCPSNFVRDTMVMNGIPEKKCFVSHFGVDTSIFKPRENLPESPVFVCVGSICLRKGHQYLFRAFQKVISEVPSARLICVGGVRPDFMKEWKIWKGSIEHHDHMPHTQLALLLRNATAFVFPSLEEGFARVLSEALAVGLPIITTYESGGTTVINDQKEGLIVRARDVEGLANSMIRLANDPELCAQMGQHSLRVGAKSNTWADYTHRLFYEYIHRLNSH